MPRDWATYFTNYNHNHYSIPNQDRDANYDVLTIHAYSEFPGQIPEKVRSYRNLDGVGPVGVTEFAWGVGTGGFRCVDTGEDQKTHFNSTVDEVTGSHVPVQRLVWFSVIDNAKNKEAKCPDNTGYYTGADKANVNTYGLYKRAQDGSLPSFGAGTPARKLRNAFRCKAAGVDCP